MSEFVQARTGNEKVRKGLGQELTVAGNILPDILKMKHFNIGELFDRIWTISKKGAGSFHIHRKIMKELGALAVLGIRERPNLAQNLVTHRH